MVNTNNRFLGRSSTALGCWGHLSPVFSCFYLDSAKKELDLKLKIHIFELCYCQDKNLESVSKLKEVRSAVTYQAGFFLFHLNNLIQLTPNLLPKYQLGTGKYDCFQKTENGRGRTFRNLSFIGGFKKNE